MILNKFYMILNKVYHKLVCIFYYGIFGIQFKYSAVINKIQTKFGIFLILYSKFLPNFNFSIAYS